MIRKLITNLFPAVAVLLLFASCGNDDDYLAPDTGQPDGPQKIRFEIRHASATAGSSGSAFQTRVSTDADGNCAWTDGDKVGVYIVKGNAGLQTSGNWVDNLEMTYSNNTWTYTMPSDREYYPMGEALHFYAYYPYQGSVDPLNMVFSVEVDQSLKASLEKSDLSMATKTNVFNNANPVQLEFSHTLAMVELSVTSGGDGAKMTDLVTVTLEGCTPEVTLNLATGQASSMGGATQGIKMYRMEQSGDANYQTRYTYRALVPAQDVTAGIELFKFAQGVRSLSHQPTTQVSLVAEQLKPYKITLNSIPDPDHMYAVCDIYPHKGLPMGVIYEISNGGKSGKIVSLNESYRSWGALLVNIANNRSDAGKWLATVRLLGITGTEQKLSGTIQFASEPSGDMTLVSDLSTALVSFNTDKKTPLQLDGVMTDAPDPASFTATIKDWERGSTEPGTAN